MKNLLVISLTLILFCFTKTEAISQIIKTVGAGGDYETLYDAMAAVKNGDITGEIVFKIISDITETIPSEILASGQKSYSYTSIYIKPTGTSRTISANFSDPIITIDGGDNITIDGRVDGVGDEIQLTFRNTGGSVFHLNNDVSDNTIKYCSIKGSNSDFDKGLITLTAESEGCSNILIDNCNIGDETLYTTNGIYAESTGGGVNSNITISSCIIYNFWSDTNPSSGIFLDDRNSNWEITGNNLFQTNTISALGGNPHYGIYSSSGNAINVTNNNIGGSDILCGGNAWNVSGAFHNTFTGIFVDSENLHQSSISENTITNFSWQPQLTSDVLLTPGVWCGIRFTGGNITVSNNIIGSETGNSSIVVETSGSYNSTSYGIVGGIADANITISGNKIGSINLSTSNVDYSNSFVAIQNDGATEFIVHNNIIGSSSTAQSIHASTACENTTVGQKLVGIINNANSSNCQISDNTIANLYNSTVGLAGSAQANQIVGILVKDGKNSITGNTINQLTTTSEAGGTEKSETVIGICLSSDKANQTISRNTIKNLLNANPSSMVRISGIMYLGPTEGTNSVEGNTIAGLNITSTGVSDIKGITVISGCTNFVNNMISLGSNVTKGHYIQGIQKWTNTTGTSNFFYNSIVVSGTVTGSSDIQTFGFRQVWATPTDVIKNNIIVNTRVTSSGTGKNYAFYKDNTDNITLDYNCYYANGTGTVLGNDGTSDKTELPIVTGQDASSIIASVTFSDISTADLHTTAPELNGKATPITGITTDFDGNTRNPVYPDMGADEFTLKTIRVEPTSLVNFGLTNVRDVTAPQSYTVAGIDLSNNLVVTAPENFQVSLIDNANFGTSVSFTPENTNVSRTVYARFAPQESGFHISTINNESTGATSKSVDVSGTALGVLPLVSSSAATSLTTISAVGNGKIDHTGGDNATTRGIIVWPYTGTDLEIGGANVVDFSENGNFAAGTFSLNITGLLINARYNFRSYATNPQGTTYGETLDFWTLANVPSSPTVSGISATTVNVSVNENLNPASTQFAIHETTTNRYIQADGSMDTSPVWQTKSQWGTKTVTLYELQGRTGNRQYIFETMAKNGAGTQTEYSGTTAILTLANTPNIMWVGNPTTTTIQVSTYTYLTDYSGNTAETLYAIEETKTGKFLQTNGSLAADTAWNSRNTWDVKTVTGLSIATEYSFRSIATNDNGKRTLPGPTKSLSTHADIPGTPVLSSVTATTAQISINLATNPTSVEFAIAVTGGFVQSDGTISASPIWQTKALWDGTTIQGMSPNAVYSFSVKAKNGDGVETVSSEASSITTLAKVPLPPTLLVYSFTDRLMYYIDLSGNPEITQFAVQDSTSGKYLQYDGYLTETPEWRTKSSWEIATQYILGLLPGTEYAIRVKARNSSSIETSWGIAKKISTLPNVPGTPIISSITTNSVDFEINSNSNPENVDYAVMDGSSNQYVQEDGSLGADPFWQKKADWGTAKIVGLSPNQSIALKAKAKNKDGAESDFSEAFSGYTHAIIPAVPSINVLSTTSVSINVDPNGNPNTVYYAIQEVTTGQYINFYQGLWFEEDWRTDEFWGSFNLGGLEQSTEYQFRVKARNSDYVETEFGPVATVTTLDGPPAAPVLIAPEHGSTDLPNSIVFSWNTSTKADSYGIQLSLSEGFYNLFFEETGLTDTTIQVDNLYHESTYYWRVNAANANGTGEWSSVWRFSTEQGYPPTPTLLFPDNGAEDIDFNEVSLGWNVPINTQGFRVQVSLNSDFSSTEIDSSYNLTNWNNPHYFFLFNLTPNTTYYWRVGSVNSFGMSPWSEEWSFTTMDGTTAPTEKFFDITIYPNPVRDYLYLDGINSTNVKVVIFTESGIKVSSNQITSNKISTQSLKPGVYFIKIETHKGVVVRKFIKQ